MADIVTDVDSLHRVSDAANENEIDSIISQLEESIPANALGLAAIQIGISRRIFIANISSGSYIFVNPEITWKSADTFPSVEGCLSIPGCVRCIERHSQIEITAKVIFANLKLNTEVPKRFKHKDACIIQHEYDHINGVLISDHPETKTLEQKKTERDRTRVQRIAISRSKKNKEPKISVKRKTRLQRDIKRKKRTDRTARRQAKIRVETEERYKIEQKNLFNDQPNPA